MSGTLSDFLKSYTKYLRREAKNTNDYSKFNLYTISYRYFKSKQQMLEKRKKLKLNIDQLKNFTSEICLLESNIETDDQVSCQVLHEVADVCFISPSVIEELSNLSFKSKTDYNQNDLNEEEEMVSWSRFLSFAVSICSQDWREAVLNIVGVLQDENHYIKTKMLYRCLETYCSIDEHNNQLKHITQWLNDRDQRDSQNNVVVNESEIKFEFIHRNQLKENRILNEIIQNANE
eukprot:gb/GECH01008418.1/.p1 GENE.gb/GECH01008418.1/~~gb/GECH01008418.1/.p1  ORF type:complete len:233 (+),score=51.67 gb/GECH01008418.1/:1-699(+)